MHFGGEPDLKRTSDDHTGQQVFEKLLLLLLFTVDSICYEIRRETGCVPEEEKLVAYQKKGNWLRTRKRETGCVPEEEKLVAYQKKRNWLRTRRRETGCVPEKGKLVAYQKKRNWLRTRRRETGCVPEEEILVAYQELTNKQLLTSKGYQVDN